MTDTQQIKALRMLYGQLKKARIALGHAEERQNKLLYRFRLLENEIQRNDGD